MLMICVQNSKLHSRSHQVEKLRLLIHFLPRSDELRNWVGLRVGEGDHLLNLVDSQEASGERNTSFHGPASWNLWPCWKKVVSSLKGTQLVHANRGQHLFSSHWSGHFSTTQRREQKHNIHLSLPLNKTQTCSLVWRSLQDYNPLSLQASSSPSQRFPLPLICINPSWPQCESWSHEFQRFSPHFQAGNHPASVGNSTFVILQTSSVQPFAGTHTSFGPH